MRAEAAMTSRENNTWRILCTFVIFGALMMALVLMMV
jgi:hypothetical protein